MANRKYDSILYDFFEKQGGSVILLSQDPMFKKTLANTIFKIIGTKRDCLWAYEEAQAALKRIQECQRNKIECVVFIERFINDRPSTDIILNLKELLPDLRIIVLVGETKRENIVYFYEIGVNNVISKPASINNIIEKMAFTLKPQGKLGEYIDTGRHLLACGKFQEALNISSKILSIKPNSPAGLVLRGDVLFKKNKHAEAISCYMQAHESSRLYLEPLKSLAKAYEDVDEDKHLEYLKQLDRLSPLNVERKTCIGKVHVQRKELKVAEKYFDQALDSATKEVLSMVSTVAIWITDAIGQTSPKLAEKYLSKVIKTRGDNLGKDDINLFNKLGITLRGQGKWKEAIENYKRALAISPDDEGLYYNMGMAYYDGKEKRMAGQSFDKALSLNPQFYKSNEVVSMNLGVIFADLREYKKAIIFYENALSLNPDNKVAAPKIKELKKKIR